MSILDEVMRLIDAACNGAEFGSAIEKLNSICPVERVVDGTRMILKSARLVDGELILEEVAVPEKPAESIVVDFKIK